MKQAKSAGRPPEASGKKSPNEKTVSEVLGEVTWLMTQSSTHKQLFIGDLEWYCMPAILLRQFRMFYGPQAPAACVLWAKVSPETEARLTDGGHRIRPDEWSNGTSLWLIDVLAPFGAVDEILSDLATHAFPGEAFKYHRLNEQGVREVVEFTPASVPSARH